MEDETGRVIERASAHAHDLAERARDLTRETRRQIQRVRETSLPSWTGDVRTYLREHPLQAIVAMIAVGYVLGKLARRA